MNGPIQWTPQGFVAAMTSSTSGVEAPVVQSFDDDEQDEDDEQQTTALPLAATSPKPTRVQKALTTFNAKAIPARLNVTKLARARLREVEAEIKRLKKLEIERDELRRLLAAAKSRPAAIVRELKRPAG